MSVIDAYRKKQYSPLPCQYLASSAIELRLGLSIYDLLVLCRTNHFVCGKKPAPDPEDLVDI